MLHSMTITFLNRKSRVVEVTVTLPLYVLQSIMHDAPWDTLHSYIDWLLPDSIVDDVCPLYLKWLHLEDLSPAANTVEQSQRIHEQLESMRREFFALRGFDVDHADYLRAAMEHIEYINYLIETQGTLYSITLDDLPTQ